MGITVLLSLLQFPWLLPHSCLWFRSCIDSQQQSYTIKCRPWREQAWRCRNEAVVRGAETSKLQSTGNVVSNKIPLGQNYTVQEPECLFFLVEEMLKMCGWMGGGICREKGKQEGCLSTSIVCPLFPAMPAALIFFFKSLL